MLLMPARPTPASSPRAKMASERAFAQSRLIHADEPCGVARKITGFWVAPAMGIRMMVRLAFEQPARVRAAPSMICALASNTLLAGKQRRRRQKSPVAAHRILDFQVVAAARDVVIEPWPGAVCTAPVPAFERHIIAQNHRDLPLVERMLQQEVSSAAPLVSAITVQPPTARACMTVLHQFGGEHEPLGAVAQIEFNQGIINCGCTATARFAGKVHGVVVQMATDVGTLSNNANWSVIARPECARPDRCGPRLRNRTYTLARSYLVLHLRLGQGGAAVQATNAPVCSPCTNDPFLMMAAKPRSCFAS